MTLERPWLIAAVSEIGSTGLIAPIFRQYGP